jgi:hypothetical protein
VRRDQDDPERVGYQHHRDIHIASEMCQPLGVPGIGEAGEVESVLVSRRGDDCVSLPLERELCRSLDGVPRQATGPYRPASIATLLAGPQTPGANREPPSDGDVGKLVFSPDQGEIRVQRFDQRAGDDLRSDAARIAQRDRESRSRATSS